MGILHGQTDDYYEAVYTVKSKDPSKGWVVEKGGKIYKFRRSSIFQSENLYGDQWSLIIPLRLAEELELID